MTELLTGRPLYAGFMNGSLGIVRRVTRRGAWVEMDDGAADEITRPDLEKLTLGWAMSVHKAQGSAFRRVVIPVSPGRMLDRTLIYTAATRAKETCVFVGDVAVIAEAVRREPRADLRLQ